MEKLFANHYQQMTDVHRASSLEEYKQQVLHMRYTRYMRYTR